MLLAETKLGGQTDKAGGYTYILRELIALNVIIAGGGRCLSQSEEKRLKGGGVENSVLRVTAGPKVQEATGGRRNLYNRKHRSLNSSQHTGMIK
jgi:hypothetical protein